MAEMHIAEWSAFDWLLVAVVAISTVSAFSRGIIRVLFSIGGLVIGILVASWNYISVARMLSRWIPSFEAAQIAAFLLLLIGIVVVFGIIASIIRKTVSAIGLGLVDRVLGAAFGVLRGCFLAVVLMTVMAAFAPDSGWVKNSHLAPYFLEGSHALFFVVPDHFQKQVADGATHMLQQAPTYMKPRTLEWKHSE